MISIEKGRDSEQNLCPFSAVKGKAYEKEMYFVCGIAADGATLCGPFEDIWSDNPFCGRKQEAIVRSVHSYTRPSDIGIVLL